MSIRKFVIQVIPVFSILLVLILCGAVFMLRAPVVLVTDESLNLLYGTSRAKWIQAETSLKLLRRFIPVMILDTAPPEIAAAAVEAASRAPRAVIFPYYFEEAARRCSEEMPEIPVIILTGRQKRSSVDDDSSEGRILYIRTDIQADLFFAGSCAAILSLGDPQPEEAESEGSSVRKPGRILVYQDGTMAEADRELFVSGLQAQGYENTPIYLESGTDYSAWQDISCVVTIGPASQFYERNLKIPVILFSWLDPDLCPGNVKLIFDDSPWTLAAAAVKLLDNGGVGGDSLASEMLIPPNRGLSKAMVKRLMGSRVLIGKNEADL